MCTIDLVKAYHAYIACLNARDWDCLAQHVAVDVVHNQRPLGLAGYRGMLENDVRQIPDLVFRIELLVADAELVSCRLAFDCTPVGEFLGVPVNGRRVRFNEHVIYRFRAGKIVEVWSLLDTPVLSPLPKAG